MALTTRETVRREYHFDRAADIGEFAFPGTLAEDFTTSPEHGVMLSVGIDTGTSFLHMSDRLIWDIDLLTTVEFLVKLEDWDANTNGWIGMGSAFNADPTAIASSAFFHIAGGAAGLNLAVETDDGTNDLAQSTGWAVTGDDMARFVIDFRTGIQSISPPSRSLGGKGSVQFAATRGGSMYHLNRLGAHMDMSNYAGGLQPIVGMVQSGGAASPVAKLHVKQITIEAELPSA
jgi:hypothetical protein